MFRRFLGSWGDKLAALLPDSKFLPVEELDDAKALAATSRRVRALMDYLADGHFRRDFPGLVPGQVPVAAFRLDEMPAALETLEITA